MMKDSPPPQFIPALTGYRAVAAWMIFVLHFFPFNNPAFPPMLKNFIREWHVGVDFFFVLSGFLITFRYYRQQPLNFKKYMVNRFARIYPMYFIITAGVFIAFIFQTHTWNFEKTTEAILSFTMTKTFFSKYALSAGISQGWTLTLEELFYFTAPLYFILLRRRKRWLWILPLLLFSVSVLLKYMANTPGNSWGFMQRNFGYYIFEFFGGIALALFVLQRPNFRPRKKFLTYGGTAFILIYLFFNPFDYGSLDVIRAVQTILLTLCGILPLMWGLIFEKTCLQKILSSDLMVLLGKSSYIFYLIHKGFIAMFIYDYIASSVLIIFILLNILSILMFKFMEEPLNRWIRGRFAR